MKCQINLDQLKTLILTKGGQKRVGSFLPPPPTLSHNRISHAFSSSVLGAAHYLLTLLLKWAALRAFFNLQSIIIPLKESY